MENKPVTASRWGQDRRLEFIDFRLLWEGRLNRSDLTSFFRISTPQASLDFTRYRELAPNNMAYDSTLKAYVATDTFSPVLAKEDSSHFLNELLLRELGTLPHSESFIGWAPAVASLPSPTRKVDPKILISLIRAMQKSESVTLNYWSMSDEVPTGRTLFPASFAHDGFRWNIRAYCFKDKKYKDYVLGRISEVIGTSPLADALPEDTEWNTFLDVVIGPNPNYSDKKRISIEHDYQMVGGEAKVRIRQPQFYYLKKRLNINDSPDHVITNDQQIVFIRIDAVTDVLGNSSDE